MTTIDLIFSSDPYLTTNITATPCSLSDHHTISCNININVKCPLPTFIHTRPFHKCDIDALSCDLQSSPWHVAEIFDNIEDQVGFWEDLYLSCLDSHVPKRRQCVLAKALPWIDDDLRDLMKYRNWLHKKAIKDGSQTDWEMYKMARNRVNSDLKRSKATYFDYLCSSKIHPSQLCKHLNNVLSRKQRYSVKSLIVDGIELMDKTKIAEAMNSQFLLILLRNWISIPTLVPLLSSLQFRKKFLK